MSIDSDRAVNARIVVGFLFITSTSLLAQSTAVNLPEVTVHSPRVANQEPVGTFATPISALRFEPRVDVQGRNFAEAQADIAIRGGTFENTGVRLGALPLYDPQTGHYFAEIPVAASLLEAPSIVTGADQARNGWNASVGSVAYEWRPIRTAGFASVGGGEFSTHREEFYQGVCSKQPFVGDRHVAADFAVAHSASDGPLAFSEHRFTRYNARVQLAGPNDQTDLVYGYQSKFFGWPNLYTPFNSPETENLQTAFVALNHRTRLAGGDFVELGAYHRRNKDDYAFNRFAPVGPVHPFQHTTRVTGAALNGRATLGEIALGYRAGVVRDDLESTSLTFGRFRSRVHTSGGIFPEKTWALDSTHQLRVVAGAVFDDTNRDSSAISPMLTIAREHTRADGVLQRLHVSYAKSTQVPTYTALNSSTTAGLFRGNPDLGRSASHNFEIGAAGAWAGWKLEGAVFHRRDDKLVDWTFRRGVTARTAAAVDIDTTGFEFFAQRSFAQIDLTLGYTWLAKDANYGNTLVDASFYALNFPKHRLTAALTARLGRGWELRFDNEARVQEDNLLRRIGGDEAVLSSLGLYFRPPSHRRLLFAVQVENLWDSDFEEVPAVPAAPRQLGGSVSYTW